MKRIQVLILGDHLLVRAGIKSMLEHYEWVEVVNELDDDRNALPLIREEYPNWILIYVAAELSSLEAVQNIIEESASTPVILISLNPSEQFSYQALRAEVAGYLNNDASITELEVALKALARGQTYLRPALTKRIVKSYIHRETADDSTLVKLTPRQREVLQLIAEGRSTREIAKKLKISTRTVETHRFELMERLNIRNVAGLVRFAIENQLFISKD